ncbi:aspartyl/asparaginyl beta-hydroxylase domain-containing protein [Nostoc sp. CHAB 5784]|uniref:aspartyl/asparaginyl beta-hydroxylase domain-containing protein n=1 Tax=Nostoc mirabile TaxID=2907820 RepID=UPI001E3CA6C9|nr:aspartyl/asparaginyl beta-hydroxylase domain-containing protein [Nostoc mirabile]MCC5669482.1 aspartyl/asparaginyl beta-hydroxylase domain-containing protein [Nostoc mirabile CHAB5784]
MNKLYLEAKAKTRHLVAAMIRKFERQFEKLIRHFSLIGDATFYDSHQFSWVVDLESNWTTIRKELEEVLKYEDYLPNFQDISPEQYYLTKDNRWKTYFFYAYGLKAENNCQICPETSRLIEKVPGMKTAFFSILLPHKHIPEHCGPYKGVIRYHLGLIVPQPKENCRIRVGNDFGYWEEGKSLIFDDTFEHEVWNDTDANRVVLFLDVLRPMRFPFSVINELIIKLISWTPFIQDALLNQKEWDKRFEERHNSY